MKNGRLQIGRVLELLRFSQYILFRKTINIILNTKITLQLKRTCSCWPFFSSRGWRLNEAEQQRTRLLCTQRRASTGDFSQPELPSPATRFHGLLACISTNGFLMGGSVTLDRNPSQYYRDWGYSSILVLHTPPLDRAKGGSMSQIALFLRFWSENRHFSKKQVHNGPKFVQIGLEKVCK